MSSPDNNRYIDDLIANSIQTDNESLKPCLVFNTEESGAIFNRTMEVYSDRGKLQHFAYQFEPHPEAEPYWPFIPLIRSLIGSAGKSLESLVNPESVYPTKVEVLRNVLAQKPLCSVFEEPFFEEASYERDQITDSLISLLFQALEDNPCLCFLQDLHFASRGAFELLIRLMNHPQASKLRLICTLNKSYHFSDYERNQEYQRSLKELEETIYIYEAPSSGRVVKERLRWVRQDSLLNWEADTILDLLQKQLQLSSFRELADTAAWIQRQLLNLSFEPDPGLRYELLRHQAIAQYYLGEIDAPLQNFRNLLALAEKQKNNAWIAESYSRTALVQLQNNNIAEAERMVSQSVKFAERCQDPGVLIRSYLTRFMVCDVQATTLENEILEALIDYCKKNHYLRTLIYIHKDAFFYTDYYKDYQEILEVIDYSITVAQELRNDHALAMLYHKKGIIFSLHGDFDQTIRFFRLSEEIRTTLGEPLEIIRICNGIGFYYILLEAYPDALEYFQKAADSLYKVRSFSEICLTLLNLSLVFLMNKDYDQALELVNKTIDIMQLLRIQYIPFRSLADVYMIKAYCLLHCSEIPKAADFMGRALRSQLPLTEESQIFWQMNTGYLGLQEGEIQQALESFDRALELINLNIKSQESLMPFLYSEIAQALIEQGWKEEAKTYQEKGLAKSNELNYPLHRRWLEGLSTGPSKATLLEISAPQVHIQTLEELAKKEVTVNLLNSKINNIEFLQRLQQLFSSNFTETGISLEFLDLIQIYFAAEAGFIYQQNTEGWKVVAETNSAQVPSPNEESLRRLAEGQPSFHLPETGKQGRRRGIYCQKCSSVISIPMKKRDGYQYLIILLTLKEDTVFAEGDLDILTIAANQVQFMYDRIAYEETLKKLANTDSLTKLANRKSLQNKLREEISRILRYGKLYQNSLSIMFIDLDNFKYYNDRFGHALGDMILQNFSQLLSTQLRNIDFISRYGGDEFVLVMPETDRSGAEIVAKRTLQGLQNTRGFLKEVRDFEDQKVHIPEDKYLTCSIGLVSLGYHQLERNGSSLSPDELIEILLKSADGGLYAAKQKGKNQVTTVEPDFSSI
jgi:diguanylate cyclase (GGDEF)-like protein